MVERGLADPLASPVRGNNDFVNAFWSSGVIPSTCEYHDTPKGWHGRGSLKPTTLSHVLMLTYSEEEKEERVTRGYVLTYLSESEAGLLLWVFSLSIGCKNYYSRGCDAQGMGYNALFGWMQATSLKLYKLSLASLTRHASIVNVENIFVRQ